MDTLNWFKSTYSSGSGECVECALVLDGGVAVRDSKRPADGLLAFSPGAWQLFTAKIKNT
ncbi:MAG TPA: DUF397 domain-containing protein [Trebonia sp.]|jgi:hypothetical protein|nr:DUF397 domain-containing protein [Trebonia sp.]